MARARIVVLVIGILLTMPACDSGSELRSEYQNEMSACVLLTREEIEAAVGNPVGPGTSRLLAKTECEWDSTSGRTGISVAVGFMRVPEGGSCFHR